MVFNPIPPEPAPPAQPDRRPDDAADGVAPVDLGPDQEGVAPPSTAELIEQLQADRLWLLRQLDAGAYPELRLDLAALERELGQVLDQASERHAA